MKTGKRFFLVTFLIALMLVMGTSQGYCFKMKPSLAGQYQFTSITRDENGFQNEGVFDDSKWVQMRNELKIDGKMEAQYDFIPELRLDQFVFRYRGAYDAIYEYNDEWNDIPDDGYGTDRYNLGLDDVHVENELREVFIDTKYDACGYSVNWRPGRQIIQWGEAGLFNVVNQVNPQDLSSLRNFDNPDDLASPIWMSRLDASTPQAGIFNELSLQFLYIPDNCPTLFGPSTPTNGSPYSIFVPGLQVDQNSQTSSFDNAEYGVRLGASMGRLKTYFYFFDGFQNGPALNFSQVGAGKLILDHPEYQYLGASFNYDARAGFVFRGEGTYTQDAYYTDFTAGPEGYDNFDQYEVLLGLDKSFFATYGFPGTGGSPLSTSIEGYYRRIPDYNYNAVLRPSADYDNYRMTFVAYTFYLHGSLMPTFACIYDFENVFLTSVSLDYTPNGLLFFKIAEASTYGNQNKSMSPFTPLIASSELSLRVGYRF
jgi:hypothetical protein